MGLADLARTAAEAAGLTSPVPGEHVWFQEPHHAWFLCAWCGIVRRADGKKNDPCRGRVRVIPRHAEERAADTFKSEPGSPWYFDRCPIENKPQCPSDAQDPCEGCPGWGMECGAIWRRKETR